jgi:DNA polymerase III subunit epsilon
MGFLDRFRTRTPETPASARAPAPAAPAIVAGRAVADTPLRELPFAVLDFETSGLQPDSSRVVEVACVRMRADGSVDSELHTLVDPEGPVGPTVIHGIREEDVRGAPRFRDLIDELFVLLNGAVVVAHNASFDTRFLATELQRAGVQARTLPHICTMHMRRLVKLPGPFAHKLTWACWQEGIVMETAHAAACDARAAGGLLTRYVEEASECKIEKLSDCSARGQAAASWQQSLPQLTGRGGRARVRARSGVNSCPSNLLDRPGGNETALRVYAAALAEAASDFHISEDEVEHLHGMVGSYGLSSRQVRAAHEHHFQALLDDRLSDGILTWAEEQEVRAFGRLLGVSDARVAGVLEEAAGVATIEGKPSLVDGEGAGAGLRVCFTGPFEAIPLTREAVTELAEQAGISVTGSVSKKTDLVVCRDPHSGSGKLRRAAELGTEVIDQQTFLAIVGVEPDDHRRAHAVLERLEEKRLAQTNERERKRAETVNRARERARERAAAKRPAPTATGTGESAPLEQRLWCEAGLHEWTRPALRGRPPKSCPEHIETDR